MIFALIKASIWIGCHGIFKNRLYMAKCDIDYVEFEHHRDVYEIDDTGWKTTAVCSGTCGFSLGFPTRAKIGSIGREQSLRNRSLQMSIAKSHLKFICYEIVIPSRRLTALRSYVIKWSKSRVPYHTNSLAGFHINLSRDVESNPGPNLRQPSKPRRPQCPECGKTVRCNSKRLVCIICKSVNHLKCAYSNTTAKSLYDSEANQWTCSYCTLSCLPFHSLRSLDELVDNNLNTHDNSYAETNIHLQRPQQFSNHTSICHLNTQSMCSTFDEFYVMCNTYKYDIITLSETLLRNNHHLIEHVQIPGYQLDYRNRDNSGVAAWAYTLKNT